MNRKLIAIILSFVAISLSFLTLYAYDSPVNNSTNVSAKSYNSPLTNITLPPATLPTIKYYYGQSQSEVQITTTDWNNIFKNVFDNSSIISYNFSSNATQDLIIFDVSYTTLNPYGMEYVLALSQVGGLSVQNETKAFWLTANQSSQIKGMTNWQALNAGAYPGFSWSKPKVIPQSLTDEYIVIMLILIASIFVAYFILNRRR
ncbi:hypothetical protein [Caldiplasma sukawensis]